MTAAETSVPMDITTQNPAECQFLEQDVSVTDPPAAPSARPPDPPIYNEDKVLVSVEVLLKPSSTTRFDDVRSTVESMIEKRSMRYADSSIPVPMDNSFLVDNVQRICICDTDTWVENHDILLGKSDSSSMFFRRPAIWNRRPFTVAYKYLFIALYSIKALKYESSSIDLDS
ncbi:pachytene checkpoint protein 2 homolog [Primulina eburnea]|uniref:pachytene checkpoint protein 2 homolog n=1 Tax=Primulina eburnea TaxID=1245227 RepID=UPI003C6C7E0B